MVAAEQVHTAQAELATSLLRPLQCTDDSNYVGEYSAGKRHGHGVYSFPNGDQYLGEYCDDIPHGWVAAWLAGLPRHVMLGARLLGISLLGVRVLVLRALLSACIADVYHHQPAYMLIAGPSAASVFLHHTPFTSCLLMPHTGTACTCSAAGSATRATGPRARSMAGASTQWRLASAGRAAGAKVRWPLHGAKCMQLAEQQRTVPMCLCSRGEQRLGMVPLCTRLFVFLHHIL